MNKVILVLAIIGMASALKADAFHGVWSAWKTQHKKAYSASEELTRFGIFIENFEKVQRLNAEHDSARFALNKFSDLTGHEFAIKFASGTSDVSNKKFLETNTKDVVINGGLPDSVDWRNKGAVTPVKDQGNCGSCWSFSATGVLEGFYFVNNGKLLSFSEQQIVDCDTDINQGCNGGLAYRAVSYVAQKGIELETDYPYTAKAGKCQYDQSKAIKVAGGYSMVTPQSSDQLKAALVNTPVAVSVQADEDVFQFYSSGVVRKGCSASLNHAVLAVGYQKLGLYEAFIVKNSWGTSWGSDGYIFIGTDQTQNAGKGVCGILVRPVIVTA
jgi:cathepsin L